MRHNSSTLIGSSIGRVSEICVEHCAARIVPFRVRRDPCGPGLEYFAGLGAMSVFSTTRANEAFETAPTCPVKAPLQREIVDSGRAHVEIGSLWVQAEQALCRLPENERHVPVADATLKSDVQDAVAHRFVALVDELKPQIQRAPDAGGPLTLQKRVGSLNAVNAEYEQAQLAAAANRGAVESFQGLPVKHAMSTGAVTDAAVGAPEVEEGGPELDIIDALAGRIRAGVASGEFGDDKNEKPPGNGGGGRGRARGRGTAGFGAGGGALGVGRVPSAPRREALRCDPGVASPADEGHVHVLGGVAGSFGCAFARGAHHRSRARPRNAQLRREVPDVRAGRAPAASPVLCVPGGEARELQAQPAPGRAAGRGALAELPASILREMSEALKLDLKIEQLVAGQK